MERLTEERQLGPFASLKDKSDAVPGAFGLYDCLYSHMIAVTKLKRYEDTGLEPEEIDSVFINGVIEENRRLKDELSRIQPEPNDPLTLEELRGMVGAWVWVVVQYEHCKCDGWAKIVTPSAAAYFEKMLFFQSYEKAWLAYRRKPEEREEDCHGS